ncbi:hypothetical protein B0I03_10699 [Flavobacterium aquaticum]|jgi:ABC-type transport system involved in cytochrome bd biosynthesis fused ATPase/permease subunit|uniref:LPXTG-motif cell wall-anchored protein n=1 Tax=Flavobacterium aquaticum TaxID=1236486 RepID=A0A327YIZ6_9FLAO|nr:MULTISPECIES: hypothetical protein [Flavobacterium]MCK6606780.1 hypothetical protein [Flavobacterium sp.]RAK20988.1 hypothetical protein B0I03_10699 [Flavobacterium aquaticum]TXI67766.1 MAG: hypothetical protein E6Q46_02515 [Flavobacterium sp.]
MTYLKFIQYIYLIFAAFFLYDAFKKYSEGKPFNDILLSIIIAVVAVGMFFFRRHFQNKYQNRK